MEEKLKVMIYGPAQRLVMKLQGYHDTPFSTVNVPSSFWFESKPVLLSQCPSISPSPLKVYHWTILLMRPDSPPIPM